MKQFKNIEKELLTSEHLKKLQYSSNNLQHIFVPNYVCSLGFQYLYILNISICTHTSITGKYFPILYCTKMRNVTTCNHSSGKG